MGHRRHYTFVFAWYRRTEFLLASTPILASHTPDIAKCPPRDALVEVKISGPNLTGTVDLIGEVDGVPTTETLTFDANTSPIRRLSCIPGNCLTSITTTGFSGGETISAAYLGKGGDPIPVNCLLSDCVYGYREYSSRGQWRAKTTSHEAADGMIFIDDIYDDRPRPGDVFVELDDVGVEGAKWMVVGRPAYMGGLRRVHFELDVRRVDNANTTIVAAP